jgi:hypothetical protein
MNCAALERTAGRWARSMNSSPGATGWTRPRRKGDARNYEPGMVVEFHQNAKGFTRGDKAVVSTG